MVASAAARPAPARRCERTMKELVESAHLARKTVDERKPDRPGRPVDQVRDAVRVADEERFEMTALERSVFVWMRVTEPGQVV